MQGELGSLIAHQEADAVFTRVVDLPSAVDGAKRGGQIGQDTSHTDVVGLPRHALQTERVADGLLETMLVHGR